MDSFNVIISPKALSQLNSYIDYLQYTLLNDQAAYSVWQMPWKHWNNFQESPAA